MNIQFKLNGEDVAYDIAVNATLLAVLRANGIFGVKHGCESGECGMCTVLVDGVPMNTCVMLAVQANGRSITTIEGVGGDQMRGWKGSEPLHALQTAFVETGAIQCGYCTPAMILAARSLLDRETSPSEAQVREAPTAAEIRKPVVKREIAPVGSTAYRVIHAIKRNKADLGLLRDKRPLRCDPVEPLKIDLLELTDETCHWPVGGWPGSDPISFCGHPAAPGCSSTSRGSSG